MRGVSRLVMQGPLNHRRHLVIRDGARAAGARLIQKAINTIRPKPSAPLAHRVLMKTKFHPNLLVRKAVRTTKDDAAALRKRTRRTMAAHLPLQISALFRA